jgi:uncharacterized integral membrane protein
MRVLRSISIALLCIAGVFIASANVHTVELFYLPAADIGGWPTARSVSVPLFLVVIVTLVAGVLLGGLAAILEQLRLRTGLRRARKERDRAVDEQGKAAALLDNVSAEADGLRAEITELREELRAAGEIGMAEEPLTAFLDDPGTDRGQTVAVAAVGDVGETEQGSPSPDDNEKTPSN